VSVTLVDTNVLLDVVTEDPSWYDWSAAALAAQADRVTLAINPVIYAEASIGFARIEDLDAALPVDVFRRESIPWEAAFLAGKCFVAYRRRGGARRAPLPDFFIGAHAAVRGHALLTRDPARYRTYFPTLSLIHPPGL
jgi:predicted nucleic acid-binding protein